jgi:hypothetical protein
MLFDRCDNVLPTVSPWRGEVKLREEPGWTRVQGLRSSAMLRDANLGAHAF